MSLHSPIINDKNVSVKETACYIQDLPSRKSLSSWTLLTT
jgi:hypothetical protein